MHAPPRRVFAFAWASAARGMPCRRLSAPPLPAMWCLYIYEKEKEKHLDVWICLQFPNGIWQKSFAKGEVPVKKKMCSWKCFLPIRPCRALERLIMGWTRLFLVSQEYYSVEEGDDLIILSLLTGCIMRKSPGEWGPKGGKDLVIKWPILLQLTVF